MVTKNFRKKLAGASCILLVTLIAVTVIFGRVQQNESQKSAIASANPQVVATQISTVVAPYRFASASITAEVIEPQQSAILAKMNELSIKKENSAPVFPFDVEDLGELKVAAGTQRDNKIGNKNFPGMTVTINPSLVPYGGIVYIEGLGFRYNQPSDNTPLNTAIYIYFDSEEELNAWRHTKAKVYFVHNSEDINLDKNSIVTATDNGIFNLTAYCPCSICCEEYAASPIDKTGAIGTNVYQGTTIAADPKVLPYGTVVYIEDVGIRFVADCGGAIKTNRIDVYFENHGDAWDFGRQTQNIWILQ